MTKGQTQEALATALSLTYAFRRFDAADRGLMSGWTLDSRGSRSSALGGTNRKQLGYFNRLVSPWVCPACKVTQESEIQFKYGVCMQYQYKLDDRIEWDLTGEIYEERLPNGIGRVEGYANCKNDWYRRWATESGLLQNMPGTDFPILYSPGSLPPPAPQKRPPLSERKKWGCPESIRMSIELENDVIKRMIFPSVDELWERESKR